MAARVKLVMKATYKPQVFWLFISIILLLVNIVSLGFVLNLLRSKPVPIIDQIFWLVAIPMNLVFQTVLLVKKDFLISGNVFLV